MSSSTGTVVFNDSRVRAVDVIANEKVGIGTSLPTSNLHVSGNAYVTSNLEVGTDLQVVGNAYVSSNLEVGTANLFVDTTTGRVGVGTGSPESKLNIYLDSETGTSNTVGLTITNASSDYTSVTNGFGSRILFRTNRGGSSATNTPQSAEIKGYVYAGAGGTQDYHALDLDVYGDNSSLNKGISIQSTSATGGPADTIVHGVISASGSTSGSAHSSSCILYLLDTPQINEWSWTGATNNTLRITYSNLPAGCKAVLADVFMPQHSGNDHVGHMLGKNYSQVTMWTGGRNIRPSTQFGNMAKQVIYFNMPGQSDGFEYYFGNWWPSQIIPLDTNNRMYHTVSGESSGTSSWMYVVTKGYYL